MSAQPRTLALVSMMIASLPLLGFPYNYMSWTWSFPYGNRFQRWWWSESVTQAQSHAPYLITFVLCCYIDQVKNHVAYPPATRSTVLY